MKNLSRIPALLLFFLSGILLFGTTGYISSEDPVKVGVFEVNATPPIGSPVAYAITRSIVDSLWAKGIVILGTDKPVVLCVVDWIGIANEGQDAWRENLAKAAGTTPDHVSVHVVHQHDGRRCDFTMEKILSQYGLGGWRYDTTFSQKVIKSVANAVKNAAQTALPVTHIGFGEAKVDKVASNRRILGPDGKVAIIRWSSTRDSAAIAAPEGLIDPYLKCVSFWNKDQAIAVLNYYTTHPMSHYGKGDVSSDFPGIAREEMEQELGIPYIYFNGAGGNITAGKYNDGSPERRFVLAERMKTAMQQAWENTQKMPLNKADVKWNQVEISLPLRKAFVEKSLVDSLSNARTDSLRKFTAAKQLAWLRRTKSGHKVNISALKLGDIRLLNLPGELFIEYQLAAQKLKPDEHVCTAAYEEYGPGYICTKIAYTQGGYEDSERASFVSPKSEKVLLKAIRKVLK
jgi:hypothetical protein